MNFLGTEATQIFYLCFQLLLQCYSVNTFVLIGTCFTVSKTQTTLGDGEGQFPGVPQSMGLQRIGRDMATEQQHRALSWRTMLGFIGNLVLLLHPVLGK